MEFAERCSKAFGQLMAMAAMNIVTDLALIVLPLPLIFKSRLPLLRYIPFKPSVFLIIVIKHARARVAVHLLTS